MQPSNPQPNEADDRAGRDAEGTNFVRYLEDSIKSGAILAYAMPDALVVLSDGTAAMAEYKFQKIYTAPPFDGHGLPVSQVKRYMRVRELVGMPTSLIVEDRIDRLIYTRWLHELEATKYHDTAGTVKTPRRIYNLTELRKRDKQRYAA